jgi:hypothetical protein
LGRQRTKGEAGESSSEMRRPSRGCILGWGKWHLNFLHIREFDTTYGEFLTGSISWDALISVFHKSPIMLQRVVHQCSSASIPWSALPTLQSRPELKLLLASIW